MLAMVTNGEIIFINKTAAFLIAHNADDLFHINLTVLLSDFY